MKIYRELVEKNRDAFLADLALALATRANCLEALDRVDEAIADNREAIEALRPTFLRVPQAVIQWMVPMGQQYLQRCEKHGVEPDGELLAPIAEVLQAIQRDETDEKKVGG
ncbi:MAG: hypothetical protein ACFB6S_07050 [Geminicoccaceae bacterium]